MVFVFSLAGDDFVKKPLGRIVNGWTRTAALRASSFYLSER